MRTPSSVFSTVKVISVLALLGGAVALVGTAGSHGKTLTVHDKAFYADANAAAFVRPGLNFKINSAAVAADGTITADVSVTDPKGQPLDKDGITTPGTISMSFVAATIKSGDTQYTAYTVRPAVSSITGISTNQAGPDGTGTYKKLNDGEYLYTFKTKAPAGFDKTATHSVAVYGSRNLTDFDLGIQYADAVATFVPDGSTVKVVRDVIKTASCNKCHDQLAAHGGSRRSMELCVLCHTPQTMDPDTGNTVDMAQFIHKLHAGETLPSVQAGTPYQIIGYGGATFDWSTVAFPADVRRCEFCHEQNTGAAQAQAYLQPNQNACGSCHDDVNFAAGKNHIAQADNKLCANCHIPQGEKEYDNSIKGAHVIETQSAQQPGVVVNILKVDNGQAGKSPTVTFSVKDNAGNPIPLNQMQTTPNRVALVLAGPTTDYGYTKFTATQTTGGYISEDPTRTSQCAGDGTCTYTFTGKIPADAKGTYTIGIEARRGITLQGRGSSTISSEYGAINKVVNFSVDGTPVAPRRTVVSIDKCNQCHAFLSLHGENRNQIQQCVLCHNPSENDSARRPTTTDAVQKALPPQSVNFALMVHKIHTGEQMKEQKRGYTVIGFGGSVNDFTEVRYPAMSASGAVGDRTNCSMCHVNGSEQLPLQANLNQVKDPQGLLNPVGAATSACTACHGTVAAASHALSNTSALGETCDVCHGQDGQFSVNKVHAQ